MRRRWWIYLLIGIGFGILDWYYLDLLASLGRDPVLSDRLNKATGIIRLLVILVLVGSNYGIWLVPVIPAAIFEMRRSGSVRLAAAAAVIIWAAAMVGYYGYYALLLTFAGLPQLEFMLYSNHNSPDYWSNYWPLFKNLILGQFLEWLVIAIVAGSIVGGVSAKLYQQLRQKKELIKAAVP